MDRKALVKKDNTYCYVTNTDSYVTIHIVMMYEQFYCRQEHSFNKRKGVFFFVFALVHEVLQNG